MALHALFRREARPDIPVTGVHCDCDILIIGGGPAGSAAAILMTQAGWRVTLIERDIFPRQKVCGECVAAGNLDLLDEFGIGLAFRRAAGPELRRVGWMGAAQLITAEMPPCATGSYSFGRAIGRDQLDTLLLERARAVGATVLQPFAVEAIRGKPGLFECEYRSSAGQRGSGRRECRSLMAAAVVDAHGSWERGPRFNMEEARRKNYLRRPTDLFAFKATFRNTQLATGVLPVLAIEGGYGGMVVADGGRTTVACCIRRDILDRCRALVPGASAGTAIEIFLRRSCPALSRILQGAERAGAWLSVGPVRPGVRVHAGDAIFRIGNAAGETHPLIGEGISMALQSAALLANEFKRNRCGALSTDFQSAVQERYSSAWHRKFAFRIRVSSAYAHLAMRPFAAQRVGEAFRRWPQLLTYSAKWAGKTRHAGEVADMRLVTM